MTEPKLKCLIPKCRNVARKDWEMVTESKEHVCTLDLTHAVCRKHLIAAIEQMAENVAIET